MILIITYYNLKKKSREGYIIAVKGSFVLWLVEICQKFTNGQTNGWLDGWMDRGTKSVIWAFYSGALKINCITDTTQKGQFYALVWKL